MRNRSGLIGVGGGQLARFSVVVHIEH